MAVFTYHAKNSAGQTIKGIVEAATVEAADDVLRDRQLIVLSLKERAQQTITERITQLINHVSVKEVTFFSRQLAVLIGATIPVVRSLKVLARQTTNPNFKKIILDIAAEVDGGAKLSQAMSRYARVFDQFFIHMIRSGETTGRLDKVLEYLADQKEKDYTLRSRVRGALIYPTFILTTMSAVGVVMMTYVVPRLASIITQTGGTIPFTTRILLGTSTILTQFWWLVLLLLAVLVVSLIIYVRTPHGHYAVDLLKLRLPVFGPLYQRVTISRFAISLSNLLASGVPVTKSLAIVADIVNNAVYHDLIQKTIIEVESGNSISAVFVRSKTVPPILTQMMNVGEETGRLDDILHKLAVFYSQEVENNLNILTSLIEPIIIIVLGVAAGIMVTGILSPIYQVTTSFA